MKTIGILSIQGDFEKHENAVKNLGYKTINVKTPEDIELIDAIIIPGGESTTIGKLLVRFGMLDVLKSRILKGMPAFGTCAGLILLSKSIYLKGKLSEQPSLGLLDIETERNAYGRQIDSFETDIEIDNNSFRAVFIRAPKILSVSDKVEILSSYDGSPVIVRQNNIIAATFHPELTDNNYVHKYFCGLIK